MLYVEISSDAHSTPLRTVVQLIVDDIVCVFFLLFTFLINFYKSFAADDGDAHTQIHRCSLSMSLRYCSYLEAIRNTQFIRKLIFSISQKKMDVIFDVTTQALCAVVVYALHLPLQLMNSCAFSANHFFCFFFLSFLFSIMSQKGKQIRTTTLLESLETTKPYKKNYICTKGVALRTNVCIIPQQRKQWQKLKAFF